MNSVAQQAFIFCVAAPVLYLALIAIGRFLKRHGVPFGATYQIFCIVIAVYVPMQVLHLNFVSPPWNVARDLGSIAIVLGTVVMIAMMHRFFWEGYLERKRDLPIPKFLRQLTALLIFITALLMVLSIGYGKNITGLVFTSTVAVGIIGFAMQDLLGSIISGIAIELGKPFKPGDWLFVDNNYAEVIEVNWRSTRLRTNDHIFLDIPNNMIVKNTIVNLCYPTRLHAVRLRVGVEYSAPPNHVKAILREAAASATAVVPAPAPKVFLVDFADSAVVYEIKFWMEDRALYNDCCDSVRTHIWYGLNRAGLKVPFPIRTLQIDRSRQKEGEIPFVMRDAVCRQPLFGGLKDEERERLLAAAHLVRFGAGETLIEQGANGSSMFVMIDGTAEVLVHREEVETRVAELRQGDQFGEMSLLTGEQRSATVRALTDCETVEIDKAALAPVLQDNPELLQGLSELLARRRMEIEGALASTTEKQMIIKKQREYTANFLAKLYSFFEL